MGEVAHPEGGPAAGDPGLSLPGSGGRTLGQPDRGRDGQGHRPPGHELRPVRATWLEINASIGGDKAQPGWPAAAYDSQGYWYINTLASEGAHGIPIKAVGYDPSKKQGAIMGPFPIP